jgi:PAS domain S-box-containing protein
MESKPAPPTVKDLMSPDPISVRLSMPLDEVGQIFSKHRLTAVPVLDQYNSPQGVITDFMLVKMFIRKSADKKDGKLSSFIQEIDPLFSIEEHEPLHNAFKLMLQSPNHRLFVIKNKAIVGALSPKDLVPYLCGDGVHKQSISEELALAQKVIRKLMLDLASAKKNLVSYQKFFDESPFMMHSVDWNGNIVMANKMLHFTLGYNDQELIGKKLTDLYSHQNHKRALSGLETIKNLGFHPPLSTLMARKDQTILKVDVASMIRRDEKGASVGTISITRLTDSINMMEILAQAAHVFGMNSLGKKDQNNI